MGFTQAVSSVLGKYATFDGRAPRSEYWWWVVFSVLLNWVTGLLDTLLFGPWSLLVYGELHVFTPISTLIGLLLILPSLALSVRRFHDLGRAGWWLLLALTGIGTLVVTVWFMFRGTPGPNDYGPDPLGPPSV
ncbi:DUF805 domain-containing protein [Ancylobacter lacus]|uniref:DUF805 domain-containing protein n=1 Tax=Ancylobacter lacus TaxID=2579970 RepID=UPI001BCF68E2|nr:DUF805 domain-containing protein [Ancylobacter lacus]MBS7538294.1 DUF805 domain-containing protein [Ancylobacter lacus]